MNVSEEDLKEYYFSRFPSTVAAKLIVDPVSKASKGFGFVKFSDSAEADKAIFQTNNKILKGRAIKTNRAAVKKSSDFLPEIQEQAPLAVDPNQAVLFAKTGKTSNVPLNYPLCL